jgi:hypothetical protein
MYLSIPSKVASDTSFPFKEDEHVLVRISRGRIVAMRYVSREQVEE